MTKATVKIPGKIMLAGEYAVLKGARALALTVDARMTVEVTSKPETRDGTEGFSVRSDIWREAEFIPSHFALGTSPFSDPLLESVVFSMKKYEIKSGTVSVTSGWPISYGLGSSSAVRLGVLLGFAALKQKSNSAGLDLKQRFTAARYAYDLQKNHQKNASGYDIITQLLGGVVSMSLKDSQGGAARLSQWLGLSRSEWPGHFAQMIGHQEALNQTVHVFVGGKGAPTGPVMSDTMTWLKEQKRDTDLLQSSENLVDQLLKTINNSVASEDLLRLMNLVGAHRRIFIDSPHFPSELRQALEPIPGKDELWSYKTTGAGGEDAIILFGSESAIASPAQALQSIGWHRLEYPFTQSGAEVSLESEEGITTP